MTDLKAIWEYTLDEMRDLADTPLVTMEEAMGAEDRFLMDVITWCFIRGERSEEVAEQWRRWQGELYTMREEGK